MRVEWIGGQCVSAKPRIGIILIHGTIATVGILLLSRTAKAWHLLPHDRDGVERLASRLRLSPIVAQLLLNRGLADPEAAQRFVQAPLNGLHGPELLPG